MTSHAPAMRKIAVLAGVILAAASLAPAASAAPAARSQEAPAGDLYVPRPNSGAKRQVARLTSEGRKAEARRIKAMLDTPQAVWFTQGTPASVKRDVRSEVSRAADKGTVPVLV